MDDAVESWNKAHTDRQIELTTDVYPVYVMYNKLLIVLQSVTGVPDIVDKENISVFQLRDAIFSVKPIAE